MRSSTSISSNGTTGSSGTHGGSKRALGKAMTKGGLLFKGKGAGSLGKQEEDVRSRMATASETFRKAVLESQALRQEYFNFQLPKILRVRTDCRQSLRDKLTLAAERMRRRARHGHSVPFVTVRVPVRIDSGW